MEGKTQSNNNVFLEVQKYRQKWLKHIISIAFFQFNGGVHIESSSRIKATKVIVYIYLSCISIII